MKNEKKNIQFEIVKHLETLGTTRGFSSEQLNIEVNLVKWSNGKVKLDIRPWNKEHTVCGKGISLKYDEAIILMNIMRDEDIELLLETVDE